MRPSFHDSKTTLRADLMKERELREQSREFLQHFVAASRGDSQNLETPAWKPVKDLLAGISRTRAAQGFTPSETATFVFSLKEPLFDLIQRQGGNAIDLVWQASKLVDKLGLFSVEYFMAGRETVIREQQESMLELSTPVVNLWEGILALPMIGTLDSSRTQTVMENLLQRIVETGADVAVLAAAADTDEPGLNEARA